MTIPFLRPTWVDIDLAAYERNLQKVRLCVGPQVKILSLQKANAYGHGAVALSQFAQRKNLCQFLGVASVEEGIILRQNGITLPILVLGSLYPFEAFETAIEYDLSVAIASVEAAQAVIRAARQTGKKARCHVKLDSGMGRIGTRLSGIAKIMELLRADESIVLEGLFTHLSSVDSDAAYTDEQVSIFRQAVAQLKAQNSPRPICHIAASPAIELRPDCYYDMVRAGHASFGLSDGFEPILSWKSRIVFLKEVAAGASISYNRSFRAAQPMKVATIPVGYGDGYLRTLSHKAEVLIGGQRCRVLGNITMDMCMVDVSALPQVRVGDEVVLIGRQGAEQILARELAERAGTIDYEITTLIALRVPRFYHE